MKAGGKKYKKGDFITIDGTFGEVYKGKMDLLEP
jgi:phosphohistidine swiveling domain-containing protein